MSGSPTSSGAASGRAILDGDLAPRATDSGAGGGPAIDILYVGTLYPPHRIRALAPRGAGAVADAARFTARHPAVLTTWLPVPVGSGELPDGSRDAAYREAEDAGIRTILAGAADPLARRQLVQLRQVDVVVAIADHLRDALAPLALRQVTVVPNPVDLERFTPGPKPPALLESIGIGARDVVVRHVSNFKLAKRVIDILASAARVLAARADMVYVLVGDGPDRVTAEAQTQASGRLLVASDIPATRAVVADGRTGLVFPTGDVAGLAARTLWAAGDLAHRAAIGRSARAAVRAHAEPAILDAHARLLEEVVAGRRLAGPSCASGAEQLGDDLRALVDAQGGRLVAATPVATLPSPTRSRAAFHLSFADGRELKGRRAASEDCAARVERWSALLDPRHFPRLLARRGAALLSEWVEGAPGTDTVTTAALWRQAGVVQGGLHRTPVPDEATREGREQWRDWARRLDRNLHALVDAGRLDGTAAARARTVAETAAPQDVDVGLVHGDLCLENIVLRDGIIQVVDTEDLRVYACDHDLARTWYRWPMAGAAWHAYREGYETARRTWPFLDHFAHWAIVVLVESAAFRLRAGVAGAEQPLARLCDLLARDEAHAPPLPGAAAIPAGG